MVIPGTNVTVFYGMQKTCDFSGREFYALGTYENASFTLLDDRSDYASNAAFLRIAPGTSPKRRSCRPR